MEDERRPPEDVSDAEVLDDDRSSNHLEEEPELKPKHTIFLSHSGVDKSFVRQLNEDLETALLCPFFDQRDYSLPLGKKYAPLIMKAAKRCLVAVVVLSEAFVTSKWPMLELITFVGAKKPKRRSSVKIPAEVNESTENRPPSRKESDCDNPALSLLPLFYKLKPDDLNSEAHRTKFWRQLVKNELLKRDETPVGGAITAKQHAKVEEALEKRGITREKYDDALKYLLQYSGLLLEKAGGDDVKYRKKVVNALMELVPRLLQVDTSDIIASKRLCEEIEKMFGEKGPHSLGLHGVAGLGKSKICCGTMFQHFQEKFRGRYCHVMIENDAFADDKGVSQKKRLERIKLAVQQLVGAPKKLSKVMTEEEGKRYLKDRLKSIEEPVFLVVDNASESSQSEAEWYAKTLPKALPKAHKSYVLVTSRSREVLENILGPDFCKPFPTLTDEEAMELLLSTASPGMKSLPDPDSHERAVLKGCLSKCCMDGKIVPRLLSKLAIFLRGKSEGIISWEEHIEDVESINELEYEKLDDVSKLIFLDLTFFAESMCFTHMDFHSDLEWDEHSNYKLAVRFIAMLHGLRVPAAEKKVKDLQRFFLKVTKNRISVLDDDIEFARSVMKSADAMEKKWCMVCIEDDDEDFVEGIVRVALIDLGFDPDLHDISKWRTVKFLYLYRVKNLETIDLGGLSSLRVLRVSECYDLKKIECTCSYVSNGRCPCYEKNRGCLSELRVVELVYLEELKKVPFTMHSRKVETLWFFECPGLSRMPDLRNCKQLKRLRLPCSDFRNFQGLGNNHELTELAFHWETETVVHFTEEMRKKLLQEIMSLTNLRVLDIVDEREVYDWIPAGISLDVSRLIQLTFLDLSCATTVEEVKGLERLFHLTALGLYGCCELRRLPDLTRFKKLKRLCIAHCHKLAPPDDEDGVPLEVPLGVLPEAFHAIGESCAFGAHECLDPWLRSDAGEVAGERAGSPEEARARAYAEVRTDAEARAKAYEARACAEVREGDEDHEEDHDEGHEKDHGEVYEDEDEDEEDEEWDWKEDEDEDEEDEEWDWEEESDEERGLQEEGDGIGTCKHCNPKEWESVVAKDTESESIVDHAAEMSDQNVESEGEERPRRIEATMSSSVSKVENGDKMPFTIPTDLLASIRENLVHNRDLLAQVSDAVQKNLDLLETLSNLAINSGEKAGQSKGVGTDLQ